MPTTFGSGQDCKQYLVGLLSDIRQSETDLDDLLSPLGPLFYLCGPSFTENEIRRYIAYMGVDVEENFDDVRRFVTMWVAVGLLEMTEQLETSILDITLPLFWEAKFSEDAMAETKRMREEAEITRSLL